MFKNDFTLLGGKTDILKFLLSIGIVVIHFTNIGIISPILRCAVPVFFMLSSYFFFRKFSYANYQDKKALYVTYIKRNAQLYLFWFVLLLPFTIMWRDWFSNGFQSGILRMLQSLIFSSTFPVSWYLTASIIGITIICLLNRVKNCTIVYVFIFAVYLFCCLTSNYGLLIKDTNLGLIYNQYKSIFTPPYNSFPVSLIWIQLGKMIAENERKLISVKTNILFTIFAISVTLLYIEYLIIKLNGFSQADDCYIMLIPVCTIFVVLFGRFNIHTAPKTFYRKASTIIYCCHYPVGVIICFLLEKIGVVTSFLTFPLTFVISLIISIIIIKLDTKLPILRYSY